MSAEAARAAAPPLFSPRIVMWMVLVGVISFCAFMALSAYAPDLRSGQDGGAHALSKSAVGFAGLAELLREQGVPVQVSRGQLPKTKEDRGLLILTPLVETAPKEVGKVRFSGTVLVVLPKWATQPKPLNQDWVDKIAILPPALVARPLSELSSTTSIQQRKGAARLYLKAAEGQPYFTGDGNTGPVDRLQTLSGPDWTPVLIDESGRAVIAVHKKRPILVLADPDLLNTHALADLQTARNASEIVNILRADGPVFQDVTLNGFPPARTIRALALGPQTLADNSAALVRMARREHRMAEPYAALVRDAAARAVGAPRDLDAGQLEALLDRLGAGRGAEASFSELMAQAQNVRTDGELMRVARRLHQWRTEMTRDGR